MRLLRLILFAGAMLIVSDGEARSLTSKLAKGTPRIRMGALPIPNLTFLVPMPFAHPKRLGRHRHRSIFGIGEATGILYTRRGGFIDLAHTRNSADWTATLAARIEANIRRGDTALEFKVIGPSVFSIRFNIPDEWDSLSADARSEREQDLSIRIAQYGSYVACVWHETITWYGYSIIPWVSERCSAFSYEETYSDALGIQLAGQALRDPVRPYDAAMTHALNEEIERLGGLRKCQARRVGKLVDRRWWSSCTMWPLNHKLSRRNLDIGLDDGDIAPWLALADDDPVAVPVPPLPANVTMTITPHLKTWPSRAFPDADPKTVRINVGTDLERMIDVLRQDVRNELGPNADKKD